MNAIGNFLLRVLFWLRVILLNVFLYFGAIPSTN